ncbi:MAG: GTP 3',8-cyclase MoaA [Cytophagales bacterium]|nr:GTP 3',8-cyclase MoaA [Cytophagales bacterium]
MLKDAFGRPHDYLRISLTDKCNFKCVYCMPENSCFLPHDQLLTRDEILEIAKVFVELGIKKIRLTGGEPLVRKDAAHIIEQLGKLPVELAITTNGYLLDSYLNTFKKAGTKSVNVSLDTLNEDKFLTITKRDCFYKTLANIHLFINEGFHVKVNTVVIKGMNENEIVDFVKWTRNSNIHVRFIEFMPFNGNQWQRDKIVPFKEMLGRIKDIYTIEKLQDAPNSTSKSYRVKGFDGTFAVISSVTAPFCNDCNRIRLTADGKLKNCLFSNDEADLLQALRNGKDIKPIIIECIARKYKERGGLKQFDLKAPNTWDDRAFKHDYERGRCMTAIGG